MKKDLREIDRCRVQLTGYCNTNPGDTWGGFLVYVGAVPLRVIFCDGEETGWEHASVSPHSEARTPTWAEMAAVKAVFWEPEECVIEFHPPASEYVNTHPFVLHLWRPTTQAIPRPPRDLV